ncbi:MULTISPECIES: helix-turn-helix domain-containing protein [unclassified Streptomyces]|uniref:helix-turn-helix domain-containing protein n=1 Tax=unclassified Streptomyces TaxID=2593676 RepID=UPI002252E0BC|nr:MULTISPECIES: acyl-CoA dehydrogenase family protein [unclassified Streptomyces]MCX4785037.1 acyl-CoA dehydrogenase family protein [Streptomyces sp. NBC_01221]WSP59892.1 acyl-CoA dehydrogenase family protein [Streptomyces sp. NBC_01241]WSP67622.1 acyl-CoA dehydrogenase family protein [Streptomyces sp. NBC_01240]WSU26690.1 acyl-CoA dehydrogenase family protein [Streptomyces sp. NBC_01108]
MAEDLGAAQADLGGCFADLEAGRALTVDAARAFDSGSIPRHRIAAAKPFCSEMAGRVADRCVQLPGGEPRQPEHFLAVVDHGGPGRAAERLHLSHTHPLRLDPCPVT